MSDKARELTVSLEDAKEAYTRQAASTSLSASRKEAELEQLRARIHSLTVQLETLEKNYFERWIEPDELKRSLKVDEVLIDLLKIDAPDAHDNAQYVAWVTSPGAPFKRVNLGAAAPIEQLVNDIRDKIRELSQLTGEIKSQGEAKATVELNLLLKELSSKVWTPLAEFVGDARTVVLSPDAELWLVPWAALPVNDELLIEKFTLQFVTSARDVVQPKSFRVTTSAPVIFADPDFDSSSIDKRKSIAAVLKQVQDADEQPTRSFSAKGKLPKVKRLPSTAYEAKFIQPNIEKLTGIAPQVYASNFALESVVKRVQRPKVAVFATHGYFLPSQQPTSKPAFAIDPAAGPQHSDVDGKAIENPLLRCGLLLAGCNDRDEKTVSDDGILTGLEIVNLDFRGTELVVLSACDTGVGDVKNGQGVAGLRQAFQLAGARSIVASLWQCLIERAPY